MVAKSKKDEPCYTRTSKSGKTYVTCEGEQKRNVKLQREISGLHGRKRKKVTKSEFTDARAGLRNIMMSAPFVLEGLDVSSKVDRMRDEGVQSGKISSQNLLNLKITAAQAIGKKSSRSWK